MNTKTEKPKSFGTKMENRSKKQPKPQNRKSHCPPPYLNIVIPFVRLNGATKYATNAIGKYFNTFKISQISFTYGEGKRNSLTFTECSVNSACTAILKITQPQCNVIRVHTPILSLIYFKRLLFGHFCTKTNLLLINNRLVRLLHRLIQLENKSPVQNTIYTSRHYFFYPRTVCILIYGAVILDFMESSAILNHQALVKP